MSVAMMNPQPPLDAEQKSRLASVPAWGSYLYQNFLLPAFSPTTSMSEWLNLNTPFAALTPRGSQPQQQTQPDYFGSGWKETPKANTMPFAQNDFGGYTFGPSAPQMQQSASYPTTSRSNEAGPSNYYPQFYSQPSISTSLLVNDPANYSAPLPPSIPFHPPPVDQSHSRNSINMVDGQLTHSPSPLNTQTHTPHISPKRAAKRRCDSLDESDDQEHDRLSEHEPDVPEGVERDGMIWGMKVEAYRALSARERKRVRNRISARTFRAKRKEHLSSLEENMNIKDLKLRLANEETNRLKQEVADLKRRLAKYE